MIQKICEAIKIAAPLPKEPPSWLDYPVCAEIPDVAEAVLKACEDAGMLPPCKRHKKEHYCTKESVYCFREWELE